MRILGMSGSLRSSSYNTALLQAVAEVAPPDVTVTLYSGLEDLPPFNEDREADPPAEVLRLRQAIADADAVLIATPEYNTTMPGQLKHVIDWGSRPHGPESSLWGKPAAAVGASQTDYGAMWAQDHVRKALGIAGARVLDRELAVARAQEKFADDGRLTDPELRESLSQLLGELAELHARHRAVA